MVAEVAQTGGEGHSETEGEGGGQQSVQSLHPVLSQAPLSQGKVGTKNQSEHRYQIQVSVISTFDKVTLVL